MPGDGFSGDSSDACGEPARHHAETEDGARSPLAALQEASMAGQEKDAYLALIAAHDPEIRALLDDGFEFVTNAFKSGEAPPGVKARTDQEHVRGLRQEGYQVKVSTAYDEQGHPRPSQSAIWRKKP
jgi:hypothetical protein